MIPPKKYKTLVLTLVIVSILTEFFYVTGLIQIFKAGQGISIQLLISDMPVVITITLYFLFLLIKGIELLRNGGYSDYAEYFADADYECVKEKKDAICIRFYLTRSKKKKKNTINRVGLFIGCSISAVPIAIYLCSNHDFLDSIRKAFSEGFPYYLDLVALIQNLFFAFLPIASFIEAIAFVIAILIGNNRFNYFGANVLTYICLSYLIECAFSSVGVATKAILYFTEGRDILSFLNAGNIVGVAIIVFTFLIFPILNRYIRGARSDVHDAYLKRDSFYKHAASYRKIYSSMYLSGFIFLLATVSAHLDDKSKFLLAIFLLVLLRFIHLFVAGPQIPW